MLALTYFLIVVLLLGLAAVPIGGLLALFPSQRQRGKLIAGYGFSVAIFSFIAFSIWGVDVDEEPAKRAGFSNPAEYRQAKEAGITNSTEWEALKAAEEAKAAAAAAKEQAEKEAAVRAEEERCLADLDCAVEKIKLDAFAACRVSVQSLARYDYEWTSGFSGPSFINWTWHDREKKIVAFIGNQIKFQNGFGAYQRHAYECHYDLLSGRAIRSEAYPL